MTKQVWSGLLFLAIGIYPQLLFAQTDCCIDPTCHDKAKQLVTALGKATEFLGAYPVSQPVDVDRKKQFIDSLKKNQPSNYNAVKQAAIQFNDWGGKEVSRRDCLGQEIGNLSE